MKLSTILDKTCSDDETDVEGRSQEHTHKGLPCIVLIMEWRSEKLRYACILLDAYMERRKASIPGSTGKQTGRPPRPRIRQPNAPRSHIFAPPGLPVDCYCPAWLQRTQIEEPRVYNQLDIDPIPVLDTIIKVL